MSKNRLGDLTKQRHCIHRFGEWSVEAFGSTGVFIEVAECKKCGYAKRRRKH